MMFVHLNGVRRDVAENARLSDVLDELAVPGTGVAVAVDNELVPRPLWTEHVLVDEARIEILTAVQGG